MTPPDAIEREAVLALLVEEDIIGAHTLRDKIMALIQPSAGVVERAELDEGELAPCPFCGGAAEIIEDDEAGDSAYAVQCQTRNCAASSCVMFAIKEPVEDQLVEKWNRRAASSPGVGKAEGWEIYVASRASILERGEMWRALRASGVPINSTWIDEDGPKDTRDLAGLWRRIRSEVTRAKGLILYVEPDDFPLKGAFVEIGMALAAGVPIYIVAPGVTIEGRNCRPLGSWIKHPSVLFCETVEQAAAMIATTPAPGATT